MSQDSDRGPGARVLLMAASVVVVIAGLKAASSLILPFLVAIFLAMITLPLLNWLQSKRIPQPLAVGLTILVALVVLGGIVLVVGGSIAGFTEQAPRYQAKLNDVTADAQAWLVARGIDPGLQLDQSLNELLDFNIIAATLRRLAGVFTNVFLVLLTITFILAEAAGFPTKFEAAFGKRPGTDRFANMRYEIRHYLGIKSLISLTTGSIVAASLAMIGVDFPLLWGMLAFLLNYIPTLGSILAAIPAVLLATVQLGPGRAIATAAVFIAVNIVFGSVLEPYFMGRRLGLSTLIVFLSLVFWGWVWGPVGMLFSVPLTMVVKIMLENTEDLKWLAVLLGPGPHKDRPLAHRKREAAGG